MAIACTVVLGDVLLFTETVRFARTLETLLRNGLPLLAALDLVKNVQRNAVVTGVVDTAIAAVRSGGRLAAGLATGRVLPELAVESSRSCRILMAMLGLSDLVA